MATLSVPSYVIPGTYLENIRFLEDQIQVDGIELLFFMIDEETLQLLRGEMDGITRFHRRFTYSVHLPDVLEKEHRTLIDLLRPVADRFIVHAPSPETPVDEFTRRLEAWRRDYGNVFVLENVADREFEAVANNLSDMPICCDTGHVLLDGGNPRSVLESWRSRIAEIHLHGVSHGKDHFPITGNENWFRDIKPFLDSYRGVIHIEVFDFKKLHPMLELVSRYRHGTKNSQQQECSNE